jgi:hypothetical protein
MMRGRLCRQALVLTALGFVACGGGESSTPGGPAPFGGAGGSGGGGSLPSGLPGDGVFADGQLLEVRLTIDAAAFRELEEHGNLEQYVPTAARLIRAWK